MKNNEDLKVTILHSLPGRIRFQLSHEPAESEILAASLENHEGFINLEYSPITRSVLVFFDPEKITGHEIYTRIAVSLSLEYNARPVIILAEPEHHHFNDSTLLAAFFILLSGSLRLFSMKTQSLRVLDILTGTSTAASVIDHGWREFKERGSFDPEVLSIGYSISSFMRGTVFKGAVITWLATFGRHLLDIHDPGITLTPVLSDSCVDNGEASYEISIERNSDFSDRRNLVETAQGLILTIISGGLSDTKGILEHLKDVAKAHNNTLEGMERMPQGIPIRYRSFRR